MHKFFAKTVFLGKNIINLTECHSTNDLLLLYAKEGKATHGTIVVSDHQTEGRGQRGNVWESQEGKNLLFSLLLKPKIEVRQQYFINLITSLSLLRAVEKLSPELKKLEIKWPNDLYINDKKFVGILIESSISGKSIENMVVGMGINLNQLKFEYPGATSILVEGGKVDKWQLLEIFCIELERALSGLGNDNHQIIIKQYHEKLRWRGEKRVFQEMNGNRFIGIIIGIDQAGNLMIQSNEIIRSFRVKEVKFIK